MARYGKMSEVVNLLGVSSVVGHLMGRFLRNRIYAYWKIGDSQWGFLWGSSCSFLHIMSNKLGLIFLVDDEGD